MYNDHKRFLLLIELSDKLNLKKTNGQGKLTLHVRWADGTTLYTDIV